MIHVRSTRCHGGGNGRQPCWIQSVGRPLAVRLRAENEAGRNVVLHEACNIHLQGQQGFISKDQRTNISQLRQVRNASLHGDWGGWHGSAAPRAVVGGGMAPAVRLLALHQMFRLWYGRLSRRIRGLHHYGFHNEAFMRHVQSIVERVPLEKQSARATACAQYETLTPAGILRIQLSSPAVWRSPAVILHEAHV